MAALLLSLREGLEAALIISILFGALRRFGHGELGRFIRYGLAAAVVVSAAVAGGLVAAGIELEGRAEAVFEGVAIHWSNSMSRQRAALPRQTRRVRATARPRRSPWVWLGGGLLALILVVGGVWLATRSTSQAAPGQRFPIQGQQHITPGQAHPA